MVKKNVFNATIRLFLFCSRLSRHIYHQVCDSLDAAIKGDHILEYFGTNLFQNSIKIKKNPNVDRQ